MKPPSPDKSSGRQPCPEKCAVCGDPASGYHYEVASCIGCKTFFRRVILEQRSFACDFDEECLLRVRVPGRRLCRKCRFDRCVERGMNPLGVLSNPDPWGNVVVREILAKRRAFDSDEDEDSPSTSIQLSYHPRVVEEEVQEIITGLSVLDVAVEKIRRSRHNQEISMDLTLDSLLQSKSLLGSEFGDMPGWPGQTSRQPPNFPTAELRLRDRIPHREWKDRKDFKMWPLVDLIYAVEYLKTFEFFSGLMDSDKRVIAKSVALMCSHFTNAYFSYSSKSSTTLLPCGMKPFGGKIPMDSKHELLQHRKIISLLEENALDRKEYVLLKALIACNPAIDDLSSTARRALSEEHEKYAKSLFSYTLARRGVLDGPSAYCSMLSLVNTLVHVAMKQKEMFVAHSVLGLFPRLDKVPLMRELQWT